MSSFKRKVPKTVDAQADASQMASPVGTATKEPIVLTGWKPWIHTGLGVVSSGLRELDDMIGGGFPLGTLTCHVTENYSAYGQTLVAYNLAEGISHGHDNLLLVNSGHEAERLLRLLPHNNHVEKLDSQLSVGNGMQQPVDVSADSQATPEQPNWGLKIAWQYEKYMKKPTSSVSHHETLQKLPFCCSYDLSKRLQERLLADSLTVDVLSFSDQSLEHRLRDLLHRIVSFVSARMASSSGQSVCRVYCCALHDILASFSAQQSALQAEQDIQSLGRFLLQLKRIVRESRVLVVLSLNPTMVPAQSQLLLEQFCDAVLSVESFAGKAHVVPYEFKEFLGFFHIRKLSQCGQLAAYHPPKGCKLGIKRDRRKLHIEPLHLPPEESRAFGSAGTAAAAASVTAGGGCGTSSSLHKVGSVERSHSSHEHSHSHGHNHNEEPEPEKTAMLSAMSSMSMSAGTATAAPQEPTKGKLASILAAARESRAAAKGASSTASSFKPISISKPVSKPSPSSLDF